jgi:DNA (cytosine-5)-methyltransferase 1
MLEDHYVDLCAPTILSLCSGVGALELGIQLAAPNARVVCYVEREAFPCSVLVTRMQDGVLDEAPLWTDITSFDGKPWRGVVDCVSAGYPCQPFSCAGAGFGPDDERNTWPEITRILEEVQPSLVFCENVSNHLHEGFDGVALDLDALGYRIAALLIRASDVGASHGRERLFFMGQRSVMAHTNGFGSSFWETCTWDKHTQLSCRDATYPPPPEDRARWGQWLEQRPETEPSLLRGSDGLACRVDRLRAVGNAVVPSVAATAWHVLRQALHEPPPV